MKCLHKTFLQIEINITFFDSTEFNAPQDPWKCLGYTSAVEKNAQTWQASTRDQTSELRTVVPCSAFFGYYRTMVQLPNWGGRLDI